MFYGVRDRTSMMAIIAYEATPNRLRWQISMLRFQNGVYKFPLPKEMFPHFLFASNFFFTLKFFTLTYRCQIIPRSDLQAPAPMPPESSRSPSLRLLPPNHQGTPNFSLPKLSYRRADMKLSPSGICLHERYQSKSPPVHRPQFHQYLSAPSRCWILRSIFIISCPRGFFHLIKNHKPISLATF